MQHINPCNDNDLRAKLANWEKLGRAGDEDLNLWRTSSKSRWFPASKKNKKQAKFLSLLGLGVWMLKGEEGEGVIKREKEGVKRRNTSQDNKYFPTKKVPIEFPVVKRKNCIYLRSCRKQSPTLKLPEFSGCVLQGRGIPIVRKIVPTTRTIFFQLFGVTHFSL